MLNRNGGKKLTTIMASIVVSAMVTSGCAVRPKHDSTTTPTTGGTTETKNALATPVNPPYPGPYKTVEIDGVEYKQGRFLEGKFGGTLTQAVIASDPKTYNPWVASDSMSAQLSGYLFPALVGMDTYTGDIIPDMASDIKIEPDHLSYIIKLRKGLKWSDGKPITSADVEFTFNKIVKEAYGNSSLRDGLIVAGKFPEVTIVDPLTVKFVTAKPFAPFLRSVSINIAPKHVIEPILSKADGRRKFEQLWSQADPTLTDTLVTSGPFTVSQLVPSQRIEFKRTNNYFYIDPDGKKRLPYLDKLLFSIVPDVNVNLMKFKGYETDIAGIRSKDSAKLLTEQDKLNFKLFNLGPMTSTTFVMFNLNQRKNDKGKPYVTPYKSAWFNDVRFRQAINHAIDRQQIIDGYLKGIGASAWGSEPVVSPFFDPSLKPIEFNPELSKQLLAQSGFKLGKDGMLHDKDGHLVEFDLLASAGGTFFDAVAGFMGNDLKRIGIKMNYQPVEGNVLMEKVDNSKEWEAALYGLTGDPMDPNSGANVWRSDGRLHLFDERNAGANGTIVVHDGRPWEKQIDEIFDKGASELNLDDRKRIYYGYQKIAYDQVPFVYLVTPMDIVAARNTLRNYSPNKLSQSVLGLHNLEEIWKEGTK